MLFLVWNFYSNQKYKILGHIYDGVHTPLDDIKTLREWYKGIRHDYGVGFDESVAPKLFNELEHLTTYGTANEKGTGLGLLICKNLVEQNGGTIWAEGKPNQGATFYFTIPV